MEIRTREGKLIGNIIGGSGLTTDEAMKLLGYEWVSDENDGDHWKNEDGDEYWAEDIE